MESNITTVATGDKWIGNGFRHSSAVITELISKSKKELFLTVYLLTNADIVKCIENVLQNGVSVIVYYYFYD